ncbi:hypothetical protein DM860_008722 [Cuscuta australis]|uniref:Uncharacterized protein n=1 Tax=Cuscuta australis TaxID=267555 RepID=A0A328D6H1_9ASTE|nr:hypothetical protein DM860_008722 [Cuscuta australis]
MGIMVTALVFVALGVLASFCATICFNRGPSTNLYRSVLARSFSILSIWLHVTLIATATVCCWMMWGIVYLAQMKPLIVPILSEGD